MRTGKPKVKKSAGRYSKTLRRIQEDPNIREPGGVYYDGSKSPKGLETKRIVEGGEEYDDDKGSV
jgi:hypothetical protein